MAAESVRILGIDPGSQITGFGVVEAIGNRTTAVSGAASGPKASTASGCATSFIRSAGSFAS